MAGEADAGAKIEGDKPFNDFLRDEYNNIAQAHFDTSKSISEFFKSYIAIASLPISAAVIFLKPEDLKKSGITDFLCAQPVIPLILFGAVLLLSLFVLGYVVNLRCDALLYARTVNGIRKYFYETSSLDIEAERRFRMLPRRTEAPKYFELRYFFFVVLAFAVVSSAYWLAGIYFFYHARSLPVSWDFWGIFGLSPALHIGLYVWITRYRDRRYLRSRILGVDVDGVLNQHRQHFSAVLRERTGKQLAPDAITHVPVRETPDAGITAEDERLVFNWPTYWTEMPETPGVADAVQRIRNDLYFDVWIFTLRGWPRPSWFPAPQDVEYRMAWQGASLWSRYSFSRPVLWLERLLGRYRLPGKVIGLVEAVPIRAVTKRWLRDKGIHYDRLVLEWGNTDTRDPVLLTRNRFVISARKEILAFVEDDLNKAKRLADVCDVVFLMNHPYNQINEGVRIPRNIIRVHNWEEVLQFLRRTF